MVWFLGLGIGGLLLLVLSLAFDGVLEGLLDGLGGLDGVLSLPVIAGFLSALGFTGALVLGTTGTGAGVATGAGAVAGIGVGWVTWRFGRVLLHDTSAPAPRGEDLAGSSGSVVTAVPADGYGEVLLYLAGQPVKYAARADRAVPRGTEVWVESVLSPTSVLVRPVDR
ncbi:MULTISPECIES: hypothetical protein [unclassified Streptomyces]|uniref:hypothetical protein n=1 Tax=unclassified Streptomyces TaxID=2593676 RepID=UPI0036FAB8EF